MKAGETGAVAESGADVERLTFGWLPGQRASYLADIIATAL